MKKIISLMIIFYVGFIISFSSCSNNDGCYIFNPGGTLEDVVNYQYGVQILRIQPMDGVIFEYDENDIKYLSRKYGKWYLYEHEKDSFTQSEIIFNKTNRIEDEIYKPYIRRLMKMSLSDRKELMMVLDSVYRDRMLEERLWHVEKINGITGEKKY